MAFEVAPLPYAYEALEPYIDAQTMRLHHDKHHQAYVDNLNKAVDADANLQGKSLDEIVKNAGSAPPVVRNNGGGHWNHTFFWDIMGPGNGSGPQGALSEAITSKFGGIEQLQEQFNTAGLGRFGSGWVWLVRRGNKLEITSSPNQDNPIMDGVRPEDILLGLDVWEHAYYLKYQNRRPDYIDAWWNVVNWNGVGR